MLVNNASGAVVQYLFTGEAINNMQFVGDYPNGNHSSGRIDSNLIFAGLRNFVADTSTSGIVSAKSFIILGSGTTEVTNNDCKLSQPYATNQYSVSSVSTAVSTTTYTQKLVFSANCVWNGENNSQISEVGIVSGASKNFGQIFMLVAREVLDAPITVNNGDIFTVSIAIG